DHAHRAAHHADIDAVVVDVGDGVGVGLHAAVDPHDTDAVAVAVVGIVRIGRAVAVDAGDGVVRYRHRHARRAGAGIGVADIGHDNAVADIAIDAHGRDAIEQGRHVALHRLDLDAVVVGIDDRVAGGGAVADHDVAVDALHP